MLILVSVDWIIVLFGVTFNVIDVDIGNVIVELILFVDDVKVIVFDMIIEVDIFDILVGGVLVVVGVGVGVNLIFIIVFFILRLVKFFCVLDMIC